jgi:pullulanase
MLIKNLCYAAIFGIGVAHAPMSMATKNQSTPTDEIYAAYPTYNGTDLELSVDARGTHFALWSPAAEAVQVMLYDSDRNSAATDTLHMSATANGVWRASVGKQLYGKFYTFRIKHAGKWLAQTPGIWAKAVGTNGERAAIIDLAKTNPDGWDADKGPTVNAITDAVIYEMHHRDFSVHRTSGIVHKGKFLALTEVGTTNGCGKSTGIDHLKELGVTHVHILPSYDYNSVDETNAPANQYNWGYDPYNYNVPEGSYSTDPANPQTRIREMKQMVQALHRAGIGVVMDVVYNHTADNDNSNFSLTAPGYFYRHRADGTYSDASGCGNETASDREQMRNFIVNSVKYWASEYHIDGFRFDLMAIHDIETMNAVAAALKAINPSIFVYGEGWTAGDSPLPAEQRALKENVAKMSNIAVFSDDLRDAVKGHYSNAEDRGFATGKPGNEETVKIGIVGSTAHPQVDYSKGNNSKFAYASAPTQIINYVSCHDDLTLTDKLAKSMPGSTEAERQRAARLAQTIVFTSQGTPFMFAGEEVFRDKKGVHNSYKSPDSINAIDWSLLNRNAEQFEYYKELIKLRKVHPAFRMTTAEDVAKNLVFDKVSEQNLISYSLKNNANGDSAREIKLVFNGNNHAVTVTIPKGNWTVIARDGKLCAAGLPATTAAADGATNTAAGGVETCKGGKVTVPPTSALILLR